MIYNHPLLSGKTKRSKQRSVKKLACLICGELKSHRISEHLLSVHKEDDEVKKIAKMDKGSQERRTALTLLKNKGNLFHNIEVEKGVKKGELIVIRRPDDGDYTDFLPCTSCLGYIKKKDMWRHFKRDCPNADPKSSEEKSAASIVTESQIFLDSVKEKTDSDEFPELQPILSKMHKDKFYDALSHDDLILRFGRQLLIKLGLKRKNDIAQRMRQLARLKVEMGMEKLNDVITEERFEEVMRATRKLAEWAMTDNLNAKFSKPGLALRIGHNVKKAACVKYGIATGSRHQEQKEEADGFLDLYNRMWNDNIASIAVSSLERMKYENPKILPITEDVVALGNWLDVEIEKLTKELNQDRQSSEVFRALTEAVFIKTELLNFRRSGEVESMLVRDFQRRKRSKEHINKEVLESLSNTEQTMVKR